MIANNPSAPGRAGALRPVVAVTLAIAVLSAMDAAVKTLGADMPVAQIVFLRYVAGAAFALPVFLVTGPHQITMATVRTNALRSAVMLVAASAFFYAVTRMPLAETVTLTFTAPLFVVLIARLVLGEPVLPSALVAVGIGLAGVVLVIWGDYGAVGPGALTVAGVSAALVAAIAYAFGIVLLRKHSASTPIPVMVFGQGVISALFALPFALLAWQPLSAATVALFLLIGFLGTFGHLLMAWGFSRASAGRLAPLEYSGFLWAVLFGYVLFGDLPSPGTYLGAVAIVIACAVATRPGWPIYPRRRYVPPAGRGS